MSLRQDEQQDLFKEAVDAIGDVTSGMYDVGNSRNVSRCYGALADPMPGPVVRSQVSTGAGFRPLACCTPTVFSC